MIWWPSVRKLSIHMVYTCTIQKSFTAQCIFLYLFDSNKESFKNLFNLPVIEKRQFKELWIKSFQGFP